MDLFGKEVAVLVDDLLQPGLYSTMFTAAERGLASGTYLILLQSGCSRTAKKMVLMK